MGGERGCYGGVRKRETVKGDGNACRTGRGCKLLSGKGKAVLFTALSTGNGDKVVSVAGCVCVGAGGGRQVLPVWFSGCVRRCGVRG